MEILKYVSEAGGRRWRAGGRASGDGPWTECGASTQLELGTPGTCGPSRRGYGGVTGQVVYTVSSVCAGEGTDVMAPGLQVMGA